MSHALQPGVLVACLWDRWFMGGDASEPIQGGSQKGNIYTVEHITSRRFLLIQHREYCMISLAEFPNLGTFAFENVRGEPLWRIVQKPSIGALRGLLAPQPRVGVKEYVE